MAKQTRQASGVVSGTADVSHQTAIKQKTGIAGSALASRKLAGVRGKKAAVRAAAKPVIRRAPAKAPSRASVVKKKAPGRKAPAKKL